MTASISKTIAIREARIAVAIHGSGTSWVVVAPHKSECPNGACTESHCSTYIRARVLAAACRAEVALALMGMMNGDVAYAIDCAEYDFYADHSVEALVNVGVSAYKTSTI